MTGNLLTEVDGWTPLVDMLTKELGLVTSAVYGRMWRFCQGPDRVCKASLETIATDLHLDRATVMRHAKKLCDEGYLIDLTPNLRNVPHSYALTDKIKIYAKIGVAENNTYNESVADDNTTVAENNATVAENQLKKDIKKAFKKEKRVRDARLDHPAIQVYRGNTSLYVPDNWRDEVIATVTDFEKWARVVRDWMGRGWNKGNVAGMLDVYKNGFSKNGNKPAQPPKRKQPEMTPQEIAAELRKGKQK